MQKGRVGKWYFQEATRKRNPRPVESLTFEEVLYLVLGDRRAARSIAEAAQGDLRNLHGWDVRDLTALPGVGEAYAMRLVGIMELIRRMVQGPAPKPFSKPKRFALRLDEEVQPPPPGREGQSGASGAPPQAHGGRP